MHLSVSRRAGRSTSCKSRRSAMPRRRPSACPNISVLWHGPGQWLIVRPPATTQLADELISLFGEDAAVVDLGHARATFRFEGPGARDVLANGTSVDLRPAHFAPGACALTALCKIGALLHAVARDTIDVYVPRSYEQALAEWMEHAGRGVTTASL